MQLETLDFYKDQQIALSEEMREVGPEHPRFLPAFSAYEKTVDILKEHLGKNALCIDVDVDLWDTFTQQYKKHHGVRPNRYQWSYQDVQNFFLGK